MGHPPCCFWDTPPVSVSDCARPRLRPALRPRNGPEDGAPSDRHLGRGQPDGGPDCEAVNRPSRGRLGGRAVGELLQEDETIGRRLPSAGRAQEVTIAAADRVLEPGDFLADVRVGLGRPDRVRRALALAVLGPAFQDGRGAFRGVNTRADSDRRARRTSAPGARPTGARGPRPTRAARYR